jgi:DME family drug/metabolite transporter
VTAALFAAVLLDERLGAAGIAGTALILLAVAGLGRKPAATTGVVSPAP